VLVVISAKNEANQLREEATLPIEELLERYGGAGLIVNRALANMKKGKVLSPVIRSKPNLTPDDDSNSESPMLQSPEETAAKMDNSVKLDKDGVCVKLADSISNGFNCPEDEVTDEVEVKKVVDDVATSDSNSVADVAPSSSSQNNGAAESSALCDADSAECASGSKSDSMAESGRSSSSSCNEAGGSGEPGPSSSTTSEVRFILLVWVCR